MRLLFTLITLFTISSSAISQITLLYEDFEVTNSFLVTGDVSPNNFILNTCAGNGISSVGDYSMYISQGGPDQNCGATGEFQYGYVNAGLGINEIVAYTLVKGSCAHTMNYSFDYRLTSNTPDDYAELVYSTDGGSSWIVISTLSNIVPWINTTGAIPALLDNTDFHLGIRFTYDDAIVTGLPIAFDNFEITGTSSDVTAPTLICDLTGSLEVNSICEAIVQEIPKTAFTINEYCTSVNDLVFNYNPPIGSIIAGNVGDDFILEISVEDESGNESNTCSMTIEIIDVIDPVFDVCQADTDIYLDETCEAVLPNFVPLVNATDNCSSIILYNQTPAAGTTYTASGTIPVTISATDESGNTVNCEFNVEISDTTLPTILCPTTQQLIANGSCQANLLDYTGLAIAADNCTPSGSLIISQSPVVGTTITANQVITLQVSGGTPSTPQECTFTVELIDTTTPTITCPPGQILYSDVNCEAVLGDFEGLILWSDNCNSTLASMTVTQTPVAGSTISGTTVVTIELEDPFGNATSCNFNVQLEDTIAPTITCPTPISEPTNATCQFNLDDYTTLATGLDGCTPVGDLTFSQSPLPGFTSSIPQIVTITVMDAENNQRSCQFTVSPSDTTDPIISCPPTHEVSATIDCEYVLLDESALVTVSDNCSALGDLLITQNPTATNTLPLGSSNVTFTVEDEAGNTNSCIVAFNVIDASDPIISICPPSTSAISNENCEALVADYTSLVTATDNCSVTNDLIISQSPVSGTTISANQIITITVIDEAANESECSFVLSIADTTRPTIVCPPSIEMAINSNCEYVLPDLGVDVTGTDNCSAFGAMTVTQNPLAGTTQNGITDVLLTLTDEQGNSNQCSTTVTPIDTEAPEITCPPTTNQNNGVSCDFVLPYYGTMAPVLDNCANFSITQSPAQGTNVQAGTTIITLTVTDAGGNEASCEFELNVIESQAPTITCPSDISTCNPTVTFNAPLFNDNCTVSIFQSDATGFTSGDLFPVGTTILEYTAIDSSGNTTNCSFFIEVLEAPNATILADTIALCDANSAFLQAEPANGVWTVLSGQGSFNNEFANETGVNNLLNGTSQFVWTVTTASCGTESDTIVVINSIAPSQANTQDTLIACGQTEIDLITATPSSGNGMWTTLQGATIANPSNSVTTASNLTNGWNDFVWTVSSIGCPSNSDTMHVLSSGNVEINLSDTTYCFNAGAPFTVSGTPISINQTGHWEFIVGSGIIATPSNSTTVISELALGDNLLMYSITYEQCPTDYDTIRILVNPCDDFEPIFPTVITPNADGKNDVFVIANLEKIYPDCEVIIYNRWGSVVFQSNGYQVPWDGTYNGEALPMGTYFFKLLLNDEENRSYNGPISVIH